MPTPAPPTLSQVRVPVDNTARAVTFFGSVFGWELRRTRRGPNTEAAVGLSGTAGAGMVPSAQLVFTDAPGEPDVRLGFDALDLGEAIGRVERLGGRIDQAPGDRLTVCAVDSQGTPLLLRDPRPDDVGRDDAGRLDAGRFDAGREDTGRFEPQARGVLGVIFLFARAAERAVAFYEEFAGWAFEAVGRDKDILFVRDGPPVGLRPAGKSADGQSGTVTFHISITDPEHLIKAIHAHGGQVGPPREAGIFTTRACRDDAGTRFSLWYGPA